MTSATKFIGGHADLTAGILSVRGAELVQQLAFTQVLLCQALDVQHALIRQWETV